ncbi:pyridoxal-phosphate dependent enzyme, partial [Escherichia coli]|uniref:pyridoxal-phosphate dependent enzyme n=1 Tax=Escherichia coli TaxID=562 RepID=UPI00215796D0
MRLNRYLPASPCGAEYLRAVLRSPVYEVAQVTPLQKMEKISSRLGNTILVKREDRQPVHSFKLRGAYAMIAGLNEEQKARGVVTASAGNHAQGVALAAQLLGLDAHVVMPVDAALPKLAATRGYGAQVELAGTSVDEALVVARAHAERTGAVLIHPFDHP